MGKEIDKSDLDVELILETGVRICWNGCKLLSFRKEIGRNPFICTVAIWLNKLNRYVVEANIIESLKWRLDKFMDEERSCLKITGAAICWTSVCLSHVVSLHAFVYPCV